MSNTDFTSIESLKSYLDDKAKLYNNISFIAKDPISIPKRFTKQQDIEIAGFITAMLSWGNRTTIINKSTELMALMQNEPHNFILNHTEQDLLCLIGYVHRTFQEVDLLYFIHFLHHHYTRYDSLEDAFLKDISVEFNMERALIGFHDYFFSLEHLNRTRKHVATPRNKSTCKRLLMYLRWMVRKDNSGVDFGLWSRIPMSALMIPYDVHVDRVGRHLGIITRKQKDWHTVCELSDFCRKLNPEDPALYDYALFSLGVKV